LCRVTANPCKIHQTAKRESEDKMTEVQRYTGQEDWDSLQAAADEILGYDLAKAELLDALVGVPFLITHVTFRPGITRKTKDGDKQFAYVSCEARIAPALRLPKLNAARKAAKLPEVTSLDELPFDPNTHVVFNDGSTGIYRQIVEYLVAKEFIKVTDKEEMRTNGKLGETDLDLPPGDWQDITYGELRFSPEGFGEYDAEIRLMCPRGIRLSQYTNEFNPDGSQTRYLA
jgi:hypothetical protein